ncbi:unnamed protein product [Urochloa decumbens]|uniref:Uncharacterized protein n=1 Tax=Urochloa decumbens TaxID=240449 RepID=A0ABC9BDA4_9POAL
MLVPRPEARQAEQNRESQPLAPLRLLTTPPHRDRETTPSPPMSTPGSGPRAAGLLIFLISVSAGINFGAVGFGLLLCFAGVLAGGSLVSVGIRMADDPAAPVIPAVFDGARDLAACLRSHLAVVGLVLASSAFTAVSGEADADPVLCLAMFALLLLGLSLINVGVTGDSVNSWFSSWMH